MKKTILYSILLSVLFFACRKSDNPKLPDLIRVPTPQLTLDATSDKVISPVDPASFVGKVIIDLKFPDDIKPRKFDAVIIKNGNKANVKTLQADISTFPTTITLTGQQLITLFGSPIEDGDNFDVGVDVTTQSGQLFQAFPLVGEGYGAGVAAQYGGNTTSINFLKPCPFVAADYAGDFVVQSDDWQDYATDAVIPVTMISSDKISFNYNVDPGTAIPIVLTVDLADNSISVAKQAYGSYGGDVYEAVSVPGPASLANPCNLSLSVRLTHSSGGATIGSFTIKLIKK